MYVCMLFGNISSYKEPFLLLYLPDIFFSYQLMVPTDPIYCLKVKIMHTRLF